MALAPSMQAQDKIEAAAKLAQIHHGILATVMACRTHVDDMGSALAGGQKQQIFLAPALCKQPKVPALDEAASHLDVACKQKVNDMLRSLAITRTLLAHRAATIRAADRVLVCIQGVTGASSPALLRRKNRLVQRPVICPRLSMVANHDTSPFAQHQRPTDGGTYHESNNR